MSLHDVERAWVAAVLDHEAAKLADARAAMQADVDRLRESWRSGYDRDLADSEQRRAAMRDETREFIKSLTGAADEPAPTQDVGQARAGVSAPGPTAPAGPGGSGPGPPTPRAVELAEADRIRGLSLQAFAAERDQLIRASAARHGMFG